MFNKIKRYIGNKMAYSIASKLNNLMYDYDLYEYRDSVEDIEAGFEQALEVILEDSLDCFRIENYLEEIIKDEDSGEYQYRAEKILKSISLYRKLLYRYHLVL